MWEEYSLPFGADGFDPSLSGEGKVLQSLRRNFETK